MTQLACMVDMDGAFNFRDLGGYVAAGGRRVKKGALFRSDDLSELTRRDRENVDKLRIATLIDFRDDMEVAAAPDLIPTTVRRVVPLPIDAGSLMGAVRAGGFTRAKAVGMMISVYRSLVGDFQETYREFFRIVSDPGAAPLLFHCSAGKDRTGLAGALLLSALGVDRETVMAEYLVSKACLEKKYRKGVDYDDVMEPLYSVAPEYLRAAFEVVDGRYGGMDAFLENRLGADVGALRELYTE